MARVLSPAFPKTEALFLEVEAEAKEITAAVKKHWQRAGRVLGQALARAFPPSPQFQQDLAAARAELAAR